MSNEQHTVQIELKREALKMLLKRALNTLEPHKQPENALVLADALDSGKKVEIIITE